MKKVFFLFGLLLMTSLVLISINSLSSKESKSNEFTKKEFIATVTANPDEFIVGAYHIGCTDSNRLQELGLNMWHRFLGQYDASIPGMNQTRFLKGFTVNDSLFTVIGNYQGEVVDYYDSVSQLNNNYLYLTRPKIEMLSFAQRSDYHPFIIGIGQQSTKGKWWYGYQTIGTGEEVTDGNIYARKCSTGVHSAGYVLKDLRPTWEQVKGDIPNNFFNDGQYSWYIRPNVRIPINTPPGTKIFRVDIFKKDGNLLDRTVNDSIIITRDNFGLDYNGEYKDIFFPNNQSNPLFIFNGADLYGTNPPDYSNVDYRIFWYGNCDMWLEHVRVENDWAYRLFSDFYLQPEQPWIQWETENIAENSQIKNKVYKFLIDESDYNMYPAIEYLNQKINSFKSSGSKLSLIALNNIAYTTPEQRPCSTDTIPLSVIKQDFVNSGMNEVFTDIYPLYANGYSDAQFDRYEYVPNTLPVYDYAVDKGRLGISTTPYFYEEKFNENLDNTTQHPNFHYIDFLNIVNELTRTYNVPHIAAIQIHSWYNGDEEKYSLREPTNEEIEVLAGIALTYGAKGIIYHSYNSEGELDENKKYCRGLIGNFEDASSHYCDTSRRFLNAYGQPKWQKIIHLTAKLKKLGKDIINFDNTQTYSYRYHNETERMELILNTYFAKITTFKYGSGTPICTSEDNIPQGMTYDCPEETYMQVGKFKSNANENYFMLVNRRTAPDNTAYSGERFLRIVIDANSSEFAVFRNWKIIDVESEQEVAVFDKTQTSSIDFGWINPGEIKLYRIAPVMKEGGTLLADENFGNISAFDCKDMVYGNGYNITIGQGTTIYFADSAGIEMTEGSFYCGNDMTFGTIQVNLKPKVADNGWNGISVFDGGQVYIYNTLFENPKNGSYSLSLSNTYETKIKYCTFNCSNEGNKGGIMTSCVSNSEDLPSYISYNTFSIRESELPALCIISSSGGTTNPVIIEWNNFTTSGSPLEAINLTNVQGGEIKNNTITNYVTGIKLLMSSTGIFNNQISSNLEESCGIDASNSQIIGGTSGSYFTGGLNSIVLTGSDSKCIKVTDSYFDVDCGYNLFDVDVSNAPYHWSGYVPEDIQDISDARKNCFKSNTVIDTARSSITYGEEGELVDFNFEDYDCSNYFPENYEVLVQNDGYKDTLYIYSGGEGGAQKDGENKETETISYKTLKDSINILIRKRDFSSAGTKLKEIISLYSDSSFCLPATGMLFHCTRQTDSTGTKIQEIKTFYELAMQNNSGKPELLKRLYYYTQKCKVVLGQYNSALEGFLYIMQNNQYNLLGLLASWDYAATQLLMGSGGIRIYSAFENTNNPEPDDSVRFSKPVELNKVRDNYDAAKFTKEDRKKLIKNVETAMEYEKKSDERRYDNLKEKMKNPASRESGEIQKEITKIEKIKEVVKIKKPKTHSEFTEIVRNDMLTVFGGKINKEINGKDNIIPSEYELKQNYPNPFNPVTKISFALPKESKVKLIIYDMLGREVARLINNENLSAGTYIREFNGSSHASGVYFLRILVNDGKDFSDVKKIVLLK